MPDEVIVVPTPEPITPLAMIQSAIARGIDPEQLGKLLDLQERFEQRQAMIAYGEALAAFQTECPTVLKWRQAGKTDCTAKVNYKFASFDDVMRAASPLLVKHGISISFDTQHDNQFLKVIVRIRVKSYSEDKTFTTPVPAMTVNDTQRFGAALKYGMRYALCAALNIVTTDRDDDANGLADFITPDQIGKINDLLDKSSVNLKAFLQWLALESLDQMPVREFANAVGYLQRKARQNGGGK